MDDLVVLLDRRDIAVCMEGQTLRIERPGHAPQRIPLKMIGRVVVYGSPMVSCDVWRKLADSGIPAVLFPGRGPGGIACLGGGLSTAVMIRLAQHRAAADSRTRSAVVNHIVGRKLQVQETALGLFAEENNISLSSSTGSGRYEIEAIFRSTLETIRQCRLAVEKAKDLNSARGYEGSAATAWFGLLAAVLPEKWRFSGRNRRPPRDPVNGLLSLSYTMALTEVRHAVQQRGLDPAIGYLHTPRAGRESLLLDLLEPCRPVVDVFVLKLTGSLLRPGHFSYSQQYGCRLNKEGRSIYYKQWAEQRLQWPAWNLDVPVEQTTEVNDELPDKSVRLQFVVQQVMQGMINIWRQHDSGDKTAWEDC